MGKRFEVGRRYKVVGDYLEGNATQCINEDNTFTCHRVDIIESCWTMDCSFLGDVCNDGEGYCIATLHRLLCGEVILID